MIIKSGNTYNIYNDSVVSYKQLPPQFYRIIFDQRSGWHIVDAHPIEIKEKIYGIHQNKSDKVLRAFQDSNRNLGTILSGDKGIGKSLFAKLLCIKSIKAGYPVIIVDTYIPGIATFLNEIEQPCVVLFDEFDKVFAGGEREDEQPQTEMLTLFDGISTGKKLFIVTCNDLRKLNDYFVNRPGRFHYHFRFDYPDAAAIRVYLEDNIPQSAYSDIDKIIGFSKKVPLNYDCLRAIAFELQHGETFESAIADLNILNINKEKYSIAIYFTDGTKIKIRSHYMDAFSDEEESVDIPYGDFWQVFFLHFTPCDAIYDPTLGREVLTSDKVKLEVANYLKKEDKAMYEELKNKEVQYVTFHRAFDKKVNYSVAV